MTTLNLGRVNVTSAGLTTATTAYSINDNVGTLNTLVLPGSKTDAICTGVVVNNKATQLGALRLEFFSATVSPGADNAVFNPSDADMLLVGAPPLDIPPLITYTSNQRGGVDSLGLQMHADVGATGLFFAVITLTAHTFFGAVGDLQFTFFFATDI